MRAGVLQRYVRTGTQLIQRAPYSPARRFSHHDEETSIRRPQWTGNRTDVGVTGNGGSRPQVERQTFSASLSAKSLKTLRQVQMLNVRTGATLRPFADPPGGGCLTPVRIHTIASYTNRILTSVAADYSAQVTCTASAPNQNWAAIIVTVQAWKDVTLRDEGPTVSCVDCLISPVSSDVSACAGPTCAGAWWANNLYAVKVPVGWIFPSAPAGCIGLGTAPYEWIQCSAVTDIIPISGTN
jgi:hypothetical protein